MTKKFNWRAFTSLYIVISFLIMALSGLILFIAPPGRIANWTNLTILGLTKSQWQALHTVFTFLFILAAAFHIYFNWRPLIAYLRTRVQQTTHIRKELVGSGILVTFLVFLTLMDIPPVSNFMEFSEDLSYAWSAGDTEPPIPHAELLTIEQLAEQTGKSLDLIKSNFTEKRQSLLGKEIICSGRARMNKAFANLEFIANNLEDADPERIIQKLTGK